MYREDVDRQSLSELHTEILDLLEETKSAVEFAMQDNLSVSRFLLELMYRQVDFLTDLRYDEYHDLQSRIKETLEIYQEKEREGSK